MAEAALFVAAALICYTYFGYPLLLWLLTRAKSEHIGESGYQPMVSIVLVACNEAPRIRRKVKNCLAAHYPYDKLDLIVVSDGSTDSTVQIAQEVNPVRVTVIESPTRRGKAAGLNDGVAASQAEIVVFMDARQVVEPEAIALLVAHFADESIGGVAGELVIVDDEQSGFASGVGAYWRYEKWIRRREARLDSVVGVSGALYALRRSYFRSLPAGIILDDVLIPMQAVLAGARVVFEPRAVALDTPSSDLLHERNRKTRTLAGNFQLAALRPELLNPLKNRLWWQFLSHKMLRLLVPYLLLIALGLSLLLAASHWLYLLLTAAQLLFYLLAFSGSVLPQTRTFMPVRLAFTFVAMNFFAVLGMIEFVRNKQAHLWSR